MPCRYDPTPEEIERGRIDRQAALDKLTKENDQLREVILSLVADRNYQVPKRIWAKINKNQIAHRKQDLARLEKTFIERKDTAALEKVWAADPNLPLEPQLGFDPDSF